MRRRNLGLVVAPLLLALVAACGDEEESSIDAVERVDSELVAPRANYETSRTFHDRVKPHFLALSEDEVPVPVAGTPERVVDRDGVVKVRLENGNQTLYLDLLALESELIGEHPVHKVFRLEAMGVPVESKLKKRLSSSNFPDELFHTVTFEYLRDKETSGVISEVFSDGTLLVAPFQVPPEWRGDRADMAHPTHFHVDPRALSAKGSVLADEYETEILALPFDQQRYPPSPLARKQCGVYEESLSGEGYAKVHFSVGYRFTPSGVTGNPEDGPLTFGERLSSMLSEGAGEGTSYFGFDGLWIGDRLAELQVPWIAECDAAGVAHRYQVGDGASDRYYITARRSLEPDIKQRYKLVVVDDDGASEAVYTAAGIILMAQPIPSREGYWIMSTEGWSGPDDGSPPDPRWQSVYVVNINDPDEYFPVEYPIAQFPNAPDQSGLYGTSAVLGADGRHLFNTLYGFKEEGGGLWVVDLAEVDFHANSVAFTRIVEWDHPLSWMVLESRSAGGSSFMSIIHTGKEVASDFAMTANLLRLRGSGSDFEVEHQERLLRMVGWNPVPFALQRLPGDRGFNVAMETHLNYEASLLPRAKGVYVLTVDTAQ